MTLIFEGKIYLLSIPLPKQIADNINQLIYAIAEKAGENPTTLGVHIRSEFHITLGVFKPHLFQTHKSLFKRVLQVLHASKEQYRELKHMFNGQCIVTGIGYYGKNRENLLKNEVVWASVTSTEVRHIREKIHGLLQFAGIDDHHFIFTDPHITLFSNPRDVHGIRKTKMLPLSDFIDHKNIRFSFNTVNFQKERGKVVASFGPSHEDGRPSKKYQTFAKSIHT